MVSAMITMTASVSPSFQETQKENPAMTTAATMSRIRQTRILGFAPR